MSVKIGSMDWNYFYSLVWGNKYLLSGIILIGFFALSEMVIFIFQKIFLKLAAKTQTEFDDKLVHSAHKPIAIILLLFGIRLAVEALQLPGVYISSFEKVIFTLIILAIFYLIVKVVNVALDFWSETVAKKTKSRIDDQIISIFHKFSNIVFFIICFLILLEYWGIKVGPLVASLGIAGIAVAFALQPTLSNFFGGISLMVDQAYQEGDLIKLDNGESGRVYKIGFRSTRIKTFDNELITIPNGKLAESVIQNTSQPDPIVRVAVEFGVEYGSDPDKVKKTVLGVTKKIEHILEEPEPRVLFMDMGDSALLFKATAYVDDLSNKISARERMVSDIYKALNKAKISIPFPQMDVHLKKK